MALLVIRRRFDRFVGFTRSRHEGRGLLSSKRGAGIVEWLLILLIFLIVVVGGFEVWKAFSIRESLRSGTYQAARYLSLDPDTDGWQTVAWERFIRPELENNGLVDQELLDQVIVYAVKPEPLECNIRFTISAEVPWIPVIPLSEFPSGDDAGWTIGVAYEGQVICR